MSRVMLTLIWLLVFASPSLAQGSTTFDALGGTDAVVHKDFTGQPCLKVSGFARAHIINPHLYDDVVTVANRCPERINVQVCYYHTQDCIPMEISGNDQKQAILGIMPAQTYFRFEYHEK
jgi:hypothetical protein